MVACYYTGKLEDGKVFDTNDTKSEQNQFAIQNRFPGYQIICHCAQHLMLWMAHMLSFHRQEGKEATTTALQSWHWQSYSRGENTCHLLEPWVKVERLFMNFTPFCWFQWDEALLTMSAGERAEITIEPEWGYGKKGLEGRYPLCNYMYHRYLLWTDPSCSGRCLCGIHGITISVGIWPANKALICFHPKLVLSVLRVQKCPPDDRLDDVVYTTMHVSLTV